MKYFHYKGQRQNGLPVKGWVLAPSRQEAIDDLQKKGMQLYTVQENKGAITLAVPPSELLSAFYELASLRNSGMPLDQSLGMLSESIEKSRLQTAWKEMTGMVRSGMSLSDAMLSLPDAFPRYSAHLIRIGEANGDTASALTMAAERLNEEIKLRNEVRTALTYPFFLIFVSVAVLIFLFLTVIPKFGGMVKEMGGDASWSLQIMMGISSGMLEYLWIWSSALVVGGFYLNHLRKQGRLQIWKYAQKLSFIKQLIEAWEAVQFCGSMQRLLQQGVKLLEAISLSAETLPREELRNRLQQVRKSVQQGESLGAALKEQSLFTPLVVRMITTGEAAANLPDTMKEITRLYQRNLEEGIKRALSLLEPAVIFFMGIIVGGIMVSLMSAIMSVNDLPI
ncbi:MAG: type II secretion system F family protein [Methylovulum sp.]|nr:type II secretion system F family protein [Methylovulum sp.]